MFWRISLCPPVSCKHLLERSSIRILCFGSIHKALHQVVKLGCHWFALNSSLLLFYRKLLTHRRNLKTHFNYFLSRNTLSIKTQWLIKNLQAAPRQRNHSSDSCQPGTYWSASPTGQLPKVGWLPHIPQQIWLSVESCFQVAPSLLPPSLLPAHSSLPSCSTSLGSISAAVTKQEEEVACWRERGAEESSEEEEEDSEDCEEDEEEAEEEESDEEDKGWGCPNCGRVAHPQCRMPPSPVWRCSNHSFSSLTLEEPPRKLRTEEEVSCQDEVGRCCHMHRHCQCCHRQLLHRETHGTRRCLESGRELQNKECCSLMLE